MGKSILIIGEDPAHIDFHAPDAPKGITAEAILDGLNGSKARLEAAGHAAAILLTTDETSVEAQVTAALAATRYDVIVIGAGLRTLPPLMLQFERLVNVLREAAPQAKLAFNSRPEDSDAAALRWV